MKRVMLLAFVTCSLAAFWTASFSIGGEGDKAQSEADFGSKVLMIYCKDPENGTVLNGARVRQVGNRAFLTGKLLSREGTESAWDKATHWVAIDEVVEIFEFNSVEEARKAQAEATPKKDG